MLLDGDGGGAGAVLELRDGFDDSCFVRHLNVGWFAERNERRRRVVRFTAFDGGAVCSCSQLQTNAANKYIPLKQHIQKKVPPII
jgi:hypothetical protein